MQSSGVGKRQSCEEVVGGQVSLSQGEARTDPSLTVLRGNYPANTLLLDFQPPKQRKCLRFKPPDLWCFILAAQQMQHRGARREGILCWRG